MKYDITGLGLKDDVIEFSKVEMLEAIANEQAEANRLKRIEIEILIGTARNDWLTDEGSLMYRKDLEDQA